MTALLYIILSVALAVLALFRIYSVVQAAGWLLADVKKWEKGP